MFKFFAGALGWELCFYKWKFVSSAMSGTDPIRFEAPLEVLTNDWHTAQILSKNLLGKPALRTGIAIKLRAGGDKSFQ